MSLAYSLYANGSEILETEDQAQAIQTAKAKADELQANIAIYENDETTGEQRFVMTVEPKPASRHVNIKFSATTTAISLAHPLHDEPGIKGNVSIYRVVNVPADVQNWRVMEAFSHTVIPFPDKLPVPYTVDYSQLGYGKLVKGGVRIRADQVKPGMVFKCTSYPGEGIRTCRRAWKRPTGGETLMVIDCGEGISPLQLVLSDELEIVGGEA